MTTLEMTLRQERRRRASSMRSLAARAIMLPFAWSLAIFDVFVIVWMVISSFKTTRDFVLRPFGFPEQWMAINYVDAWNAAKMGEGVLNSVILVIASGVLIIAVAAPAAYALTRVRGRGTSTMSMLFIIGLGIPVQTMALPLYVIFRQMGLIDTILGLVIINVGIGIPYAFFLLTAFFRSVPREVEEAAAIDGASTGYTFWRIVLPLVRSGLITVFVLQAIGHWGETFFALVMLQTQETVSLSVLHFMQSMQASGAQYSVLFAGLSIVVLPLLVLYLFLGSRIIEGIAQGYGK